MNLLLQLKKELEENFDLEKAKLSQRFFKTMKGEYGEGQKFLGIDTLIKRKIAKKYENLNLDDLQKLLGINIHDYKFIALVILINKFQKADERGQKKIFDLYIKNSKNINNWDLVDISAPNIVGQYLLNKDKKILYKLAKSENIWEKRISIISTFSFIRENQFEDTLRISEILLNDDHDLIHKAVGWMLREVGNKNRGVEEKFLKKHYRNMPRTMLRYAIEKFSENLRKSYLESRI